MQNENLESAFESIEAQLPAPPSSTASPTTSPSLIGLWRAGLAIATTLSMIGLVLAIVFVHAEATDDGSGFLDGVGYLIGGFLAAAALVTLLIVGVSSVVSRSNQLAGIIISAIPAGGLLLLLLPEFLQSVVGHLAGGTLAGWLLFCASAFGWADRG